MLTLKFNLLRFRSETFRLTETVLVMCEENAFGIGVVPSLVADECKPMWNNLSTKRGFTVKTNYKRRADI